VHCVNHLLEIARGDYLILTAADDLVLPGYFEKTMRLLARYPRAGLCSAGTRMLSWDGRDLGLRSLPVISREPVYVPPAEVPRKLYWYGRWIDPVTTVWRRDLLNGVGKQLTELGSFADSFSVLVIALHSGACYVPEPLACWRQVRESYSQKSSRDWEGLMRTGRRAAELMSTTYGDLFPPAYVRTFQNQWRYSLSVRTNLPPRNSGRSSAPKRR
jgi:hypothetical protein